MKIDGPKKISSTPVGKKAGKGFPGPARVEDVKIRAADEFECLGSDSRLIPRPRVRMLVQKQHPGGNCDNQYSSNGETLV